MPVLPASSSLDEQIASGTLSFENLKEKFEELSMEELPGPIRRRVIALKNLQTEHGRLEDQFDVELLQLERKFAALYKPLYDKRADIVKGKYEPTVSEVPAVPQENSAALSVVGIPEFWSTAIMNNASLKVFVTERDMEALKSLVDVRLVYPIESKQDFDLVFEFEPNDFFENSTLTKKYHYKVDEEQGEIVFDATEGTKINWKPGKCLTVHLVTKTQRHKTKNITRTVSKEEPCESFFEYFSDPVLPEQAHKQDTEEDEETEVALDAYHAKLSMDYGIGDMLKSRLIPEAVNWFLGLIMDDEDEDDYDEDEDDELEGCGDSCDEDHGGGDDDDSEEEDEGDEDPEERYGNRHSRKPANRRMPPPLPSTSTTSSIRSRPSVQPGTAATTKGTPSGGDCKQQ